MRMVATNIVYLSVYIIVFVNLVARVSSYLVYDYESPNCGPPPDWFPTEEEFDRGLVVKPPSSFFQAFAGEKSIRWLALGGSNTVGSMYIPRLKEQFEKLAKEHGFELQFWNGGVSGTGPTLQRYVFEDLPKEQWPNFVTMEFAMNTANLDTVQSMDTMMQYIELKWLQKGARLPAYLILELWRIRKLYQWDMEGWAYPMEDRNACTNTEISFNGNVTLTLSPPSDFTPTDEAFSRGLPLAMYHNALARFYRIPLISGQDVFWPSFVRYYMRHVSCSQWPFIHNDGCHISVYGGKTYVDKVVVPFVRSHLIPVAMSTKLPGKSVNKKLSTIGLGSEILSHNNHNGNNNILLPRREVTVTSGPVDGRVSDYPEIAPYVRMFPRVPSKALTIRFGKSLWGGHLELDHFLDNVAFADEEFHLQFLQFHEGSQGHRCYGAMGPHTKGKSIYFYVPMANDAFDEIITQQGKANDVLYAIEVGYLHSWNTSYIGDVDCRVLRTNISHPIHIKDLRKTIESKYPNDVLSHLLATIDAQSLTDTTKNSANTVDIIKHHWQGQRIQGNRHDREGVLKSSGPRLTMLHQKITRGHYLLQCKKLDDKLGCFTGFQTLDA